MVDQQNNTSPEDEYQFPDDEYIPSEGEGVSPQGIEEENVAKADLTVKDKIIAALQEFLPILERHKKIVMVLAIALLMIITFHFRNQDTLEPVEKTPAPAQPVVVNQTSGNDATLGSLNALQADSSQASSDIRSLQSQLADLQSAISRSQSENEQLRSVVDQLSSQIKVMSSDLHKLMTAKKAKNKGPILHYHLRAVVPNRAWIISSAGKALSVSVGDKIKSYGLVTAIYAEQGVVETSSGRKIAYGPNDS